MLIGSTRFEGQTLAAMSMVSLPLVLSLLLAPAAIGGDNSRSEEGHGSGPASQDAAAASWIAKLGHGDYAVRERAAGRLLTFGRDAIPALEIGSRNRDREIRYRCERILSLVREKEDADRIDDFVRRYDPKAEYSLNGWNVVRERLGDSAAVRMLYVQMLQSEPEILDAVERGPRVVNEKLNARALSIQQHLQQFPLDFRLGTAAALLLVLGDERIAYSPIAGQAIYTISQLPAMRAALTAGGSRDVLQSMVGRWIQRDVDDNQALQMLFIAMQYGFKEGLVPSQRLLRRSSNQPWIRHYAIMALAKLGDLGHTQELEPLLNDPSVCTSWQNNNVTYTTQVRDSALVGLLHLHKLEIAKFGFERAQADQNSLYAPHSIGFENDERRKIAFGKWEAFRKTLEADGQKPMEPNREDLQVEKNPGR